MKRMHIHIAVDELPESIRFYSTIFGISPSIEHADYAKWSIDEPAVNFAISKRGHSSGINHLGIQVDSEGELAEIKERLDKAKIAFSSQQESSCCYTLSNKHWVLDPQGIAWESFHSLGNIPTFGEEAKTGSNNKSSTCCMPLNSENESNKEDTACCISSKDNISNC